MKPRYIWGSVTRSAKWLMVYPALLAIPIAIQFVIVKLIDRDTLNWVPFNLHSILMADYSADPRGFRLHQVGLGVIEDYFRDQGYTDYNARMETLQSNMLTPVPTVTSLFPGSIALSPTPTNNIAQTETSVTTTPTEAMVTPSTTTSGTPTNTSTAQPSLTSQVTVIYPTTTSPPRSTPEPTDPPAPTATVVPPTATRRPPTATRPAPTSTRRPPDPYPGPTPYP